MCRTARPSSPRTDSTSSSARAIVSARCASSIRPQNIRWPVDMVQRCHACTSANSTGSASSTTRTSDPTFEALGDLFEPFIPKELLDPLNERDMDDPFASAETLTALAEAAGGSDVRVVEEALPVEFADVHAWQRWTMSTGQRMFWGRMDDAQRADTMARAEELVESVRGEDGRAVLHMDIRCTLGRR